MRIKQRVAEPVRAPKRPPKHIVGLPVGERPGRGGSQVVPLWSDVGGCCPGPYHYKQRLFFQKQWSQEQPPSHSLRVLFPKVLDNATFLDGWGGRRREAPEMLRRCGGTGTGMLRSGSPAQEGGQAPSGQAPRAGVLLNKGSRGERGQGLVGISRIIEHGGERTRAMGGREAGGRGGLEGRQRAQRGGAGRERGKSEILFRTGCGGGGGRGMLTRRESMIGRGGEQGGRGSSSNHGIDASHLRGRDM